MSKKYVEKYVGPKKDKKYGPETPSEKPSREAPKRASKWAPEGDPKGTFSRACCRACLELSRHLVAPSIMSSSTPGPGPMTMTTTMTMDLHTQSLRPEMIFGVVGARRPFAQSDSGGLGQSIPMTFARQISLTKGSRRNWSSWHSRLVLILCEFMLSCATSVRIPLCCTANMSTHAAQT